MPSPAPSSRGRSRNRTLSPERRGHRGRRSRSRSSRRRSPDNQPRRRRSPTCSPSRRPSQPRRKRRKLGHDESEHSDDRVVVDDAPKRRRQTKKKKQTEAAAELTGEDLVRDMGTIFGRYVNMWAPAASIFTHGLIHDPDQPLSEMSSAEIRMTRSWDIFTVTFPAVLDVLQKQVENDTGGLWTKHAANIIDSASRAARATDVSTLKDVFFKKGKNWSSPYPDDKNKAGFAHDICGKALCPSELTWNTETQRKLKDLKVKAGPEQLCLLLYRDYDPSDLDGLFKNDLVVFGAKAIFIGPAAAVNPSGGRHRAGNARKHGITKMSIPAIAYTTCLVHYTLSSQLTMGSGQEGGGWKYDTFYRYLLDRAEELHPGQRGDLLHWWNQALFGDSEDNDAATSTSEPTAVQLLSQRLQKAREEYARKLAIEAGDDPDPTVPGPSGQSSSS
ncbi:hypothetical protein K523DRAFT_283264 [Schizophyllum commune Tattone D]|nr:hypothetical protein K523DRAFT_283264 [Schizophyllum commune Tattone D]